MDYTRIRSALTVPCLALAALLLGTGCQQRGPVRAVWVTRFDYKSADDVARIIKNCDDAGFNTVVFQVRGNGTAFYPSKIEPWAEQFDYTDPGFDPLAVAIAEAHARKLELHAWMNVMPAWRGRTPPTNPQQLYNAHPEWFWYDQHGKRQALSTFYVSLNPCLPEVRTYITDVFEEVAANYDVDGLHMDYIRFPNEPPAIPQGSDIDYPRDAKTLALYKEQTGLTPDENRDAWNKWRTEQVTQLVSDIHDMLRRTRPKAVLAASVGNSVEENLRHFRDDETWARRKLIDQAYPMVYRNDLDAFKQGLTRWEGMKDTVTVVPGMWFAPRIPQDQGVEVARQQIEYAIQTTGNICVFSYSSLFDSVDRELNPPATNVAEGQKSIRDKRREAISPLISTVSEKK